MQAERLTGRKPLGLFRPLKVRTVSQYFVNIPGNYRQIPDSEKEIEIPTYAYSDQTMEEFLSMVIEKRQSERDYIAASLVDKKDKWMLRRR